MRLHSWQIWWLFLAIVLRFEMRFPPGDTACTVPGPSPGVPCGFAAAVLPLPCPAPRPRLRRHRCHSCGRPAGAGLPRRQSGRGLQCNRLWYPRSRSSVPASHGIHGQVQFAVQPPFVRPTAWLPPRAPVPSVWTLIWLASIINQSKSGSSMTVSRRSCQTPRSRQRQKRRWVFFQSPKSGGRSRQSLPRTRYGVLF